MVRVQPPQDPHGVPAKVREVSRLEPRLPRHALAALAILGQRPHRAAGETCRRRHAQHRELPPLLRPFVKVVPGRQPVLALRLEQVHHQVAKVLRCAHDDGPGIEAPARLARARLDCHDVVPLERPRSPGDRLDPVRLDVQLDVLAQFLHLDAVPLQQLDQPRHVCWDEVRERTADLDQHLVPIPDRELVVLGLPGGDAPSFEPLLHEPKGRDLLRRRRGPGSDRHQVVLGRVGTGLARARAGRAHLLRDRLPVLRSVTQDRRAEGQRSPHALLVRRVRVRLGQDPDPVAQPDVRRAEPRLIRERSPVLVVSVEVAIKEGVHPSFCLERRGDPREHGVADILAQPGVAGGDLRPRVRHQVAVQRTVRGVRVNDDGRIPRVDQPHQRPRLGRFELDEISVQVQPHGVGALAHPLLGPDLPGAVALVHPLVPVRVVDRHEDHDQVVQQRVIVHQRQLARQHQQGFFPAHLPGVDVAEQQDDHLAVILRVLRRLLGRLDRRIRDHQRRDGPPLGGLADLESMRQIRTLRDPVHQRDDFGVTGCRPEPAPLRHRLQIVRDALLRSSRARADCEHT